MIGHTNNPNGRPKGTPNKSTAAARAWISEIIEGNRATLAADIAQLEPKERIDAISKLLPYVLPKMQTQQIEIENTGGELRGNPGLVLIREMLQYDADDEESRKKSIDFAVRQLTEFIGDGGKKNNI